MHRRFVGLACSLSILAGVVITASAWEVNFDPSAYSPEVDEVVTFAVCQPCLEGEAVWYSWDFDADGVPEAETENDTVSYAFASPGFYEVVLTATSDYGRVKTRTKGLLVGAARAYAVREVLVQDDGAVFVMISIHAKTDITGGIGFTEAMPRGWQFEVLDAGGAGLANPNGTTRKYEVAWASQFEAGAELTFTYRLLPGPSASKIVFDGTLSGHSKARFVGTICGVLTVP